MNEQLTQAQHCAAFAVNHLQAALTKATPVEALLIYPMIRDAAKLDQDIRALLAAKQEK